MPLSATFRERSSRDKRKRRDSATPQASANLSTARVVFSAASKAAALARTIGKINALTRSSSMSRSCSRCCLFKCEARFVWVMWQNSQDAPFTHWLAAKYKQGRKHKSGCPMLPVLQKNRAEVVVAGEWSDMREGALVSPSTVSSCPHSPSASTLARNNNELKMLFLAANSASAASGCMARASGACATSRHRCRKPSAHRVNFSESSETYNFSWAKTSSPSSHKLGSLCARDSRSPA
mmetsp:Transcript_33257/g.66025  ORF Transcript_33257/g.66025 Transcript_33257/m.66025 type:complete len:237 (-) Transcript_33257:86-796(-)